MPNIYPYIVENPGEGTQAKRRSYAVIVDHMIPPMVLSELYGDMANLSDQIKFYHDATTEQRKRDARTESTIVGASTGSTKSRDGRVTG